MANPNIKPLGDRVLVKPLEEKEISKGGIIIPDSAKEKPQESQVVALGTGKRDDDGKLVEFTVKVGDKVLVSNTAAPKSKSKESPTPSCVKTTSSASSANHNLKLNT
jgi:chaperonin GroES